MIHICSTFDYYIHWMANVFDVAAYILHKHGKMTAMKLQKLVYYCQAWHLVWDEEPLFEEEIQAWANGPVVPELFKAHQGEFVISKEPIGDKTKLTKSEKETIKAVLESIGDRDANWLSTLTHQEDPWKDARRGLQIHERGNKPITHGAMADYYGNL